MTSTISDSQHRETTDLTDTTRHTIHTTTNDYGSSTSDNQHPETTDVTVTTASTIYTTNDDRSTTSDNQHSETTGTTIYTTNDDITSTSENWHSEITDLTLTTGTTIYTTTNDLRSTSRENWFSRTTYSTDHIDHTINTTNDVSSSSTQSTASMTSCMCACDQLGNEALVYLTFEDIKKKVNVLVEELRIDKRDTSLGMCNTLCVFCILNVYHYHWVDTIVGEQLVPRGIASPVIRTLIYITTTGYTPMQLDWYLEEITSPVVVPSYID